MSFILLAPAGIPRWKELRQHSAPGLALAGARYEPAVETCHAAGTGRSQVEV